MVVGLVKNLSLMASITVGSSGGPVLEYLDSIGMQSLDGLSSRSQVAQYVFELIFSNCVFSFAFSSTKIFVNGSWVGVHMDPDNVVANVRKYVSLSSLSLRSPEADCDEQRNTMALCQCTWLQLRFQSTATYASERSSSIQVVLLVYWASRCNKAFSRLWQDISSSPHCRKRPAGQVSAHAKKESRRSAQRRCSACCYDCERPDGCIGHWLVAPC